MSGYDDQYGSDDQHGYDDHPGPSAERQPPSYQAGQSGQYGHGVAPPSRSGRKVASPVAIGMVVAGFVGIGLLGFLAIFLLTGRSDSDSSSRFGSNDSVESVAGVDSDDQESSDNAAPEDEDDEENEEAEENDGDAGVAVEDSEATEELAPPEKAETETEVVPAETVPDPAFDPSSCLSGSDVRPAFIAGVADWVNARSEPTTDSIVISEVSRQTAVSYDADSFVWSDERGWFQIAIPAIERCAWVGGTFLISDGSYVLLPDAPIFIKRSLSGLDAEAALSRRVPPDINAELEPIDPALRASLERSVAELRSLGQQWPDAVTDPDITWIPSADEYGCYLSDTYSCEVLVKNNGDILATVSVVRTGDGWDSISIDYR